jgi:hypothetical protein
MRFRGRSIDTFESAMAMLIDDKGEVNHIDCISGRSFSLCRSVRTKLYSCTLSDIDAVNNLNKYVGCVFQVVSPEGLNEPFVLRVQNDFEMPTIFRKYYPEGHYIFCHRKGSKLIVHDPDGFPQLIFDAKKFDWDSQLAIIITGSIPAADITYTPLIKEGFAINREAQLDGYDLNRIFLQYATRNFVCQTAKIINLLKEVTRISQNEEIAFEDMFSDMIASETKDVRTILSIDEKLWSLMEEIWYSKI